MLTKTIIVFLGWSFTNFKLFQTKLFIYFSPYLAVMAVAVVDADRYLLYVNDNVTNTKYYLITQRMPKSPKEFTPWVLPDGR